MSLLDLFRRPERRDRTLPPFTLADPPAMANPPVTPYRAMNFAAVWQAVSQISGDLAGLPIELYQRQGEDRQRAVEHRWYVPIKMRPNRTLTAFRAWRRLYFWALIWGRSFALIDRANTELLPIPNDRAGVRSVDGMTVLDVTPSSGQTQTFPMSQVIELTWLEWDDDMWPSPIVALRQTVNSGLASQEFTNKFFKNGAIASGILELPAAMPKDRRDKAAEGFKGEYEGLSNAFKTIVLKDGVKFQQIMATAGDMQQTELREAEVRDVARFYNLTPSRLGLSDSISFNSKSEDNRAYIDTTLSPWMTMLEQELWLKLLRASEKTDLFFEYNANALLRADIATRYEMYDKAIKLGIMSPVDVARIENLSPNPGRSSEYVNPVTMPGSPVSSPDDDASGGQGGGTGLSEDESEGRSVFNQSAGTNGRGIVH